MMRSMAVMGLTGIVAELYGTIFHVRFVDVFAITTITYWGIVLAVRLRRRP